MLNKRKGTLFFEFFRECVYIMPKNIKYFTELLCGMILFNYLCAQSET